MSSRPASVRQSEKMFVTPLVGDVLFSERWVGQSRDVPAYSTAHPNTTRWPNHKFVFAKERGEPDAQDVYDFFYAADRPTQDLYNFEHTEADIGGTRFDAVRRTYVLPRATYTPDTPAMGATMPNSPTGMFTGTYVLAEVQQRRIGQQELDSLYVQVVRTYVKKVNIISNSFDEVFGGNLQTTETLYYRGETVSGTAIETLFADDDNAYWGLTSGVAREGRQISDNWFLVNARQVVPAIIASTGRTYTTAIDFYWPAVLSNFDVELWTRRDGGEQRYFNPVFSKEAYRGPCKATVTERFYDTAPTVGEPNVMRPLPIVIQNPFFGISVGPSLHAGDTLSFTNGTTDPEFVYTISSYTVDATTPTDWPASIVAQDEARPFRGGFLRTTITVFPPTYTP